MSQSDPITNTEAMWTKRELGGQQHVTMARMNDCDEKEVM